MMKSTDEGSSLRRQTMKYKIVAILMTVSLLINPRISTASTLEIKETVQKKNAAQEACVEAVDLGENHSGAFTTEGDLYCWGRNEHGQVGNGTTQDQYTPAKVLEDVKELSTERNNTIALTRTGDLYCWGENQYGQVGDGTTIDQYTPVKVLENVEKFQWRYFTMAALTSNGELYLWGYNDDGMIGNGTEENQSIPVKVLDNVREFKLGERVTAAITNEDELYCWGNNQYGQAGIGESFGTDIPVKVLDSVEKISLGNYFTAALQKDGELYVWGLNDRGQVGDGGKKERKDTPRKIMSQIKEVYAWYDSCAAITTGGALYCWGANEDGKIGNGSLEDQRTPVCILNNVSEMVSAQTAISETGDLYHWGERLNMEFEDLDATNIYFPQILMRNVKSFASAWMNYGILTENNDLYCIGRNQDGQIGNGGYTEQKVPVCVLGDVSAMVVGGNGLPSDDVTAAVTTDGELYLWGGNTYGQIGNGTTSKRPIPTKIVLGQERTEDTTTKEWLEEAGSGRWLYYEKEDGSVGIEEYIGEDNNLRIPEKIDGKIVTEIGSEAFLEYSDLSSVELPETLTTIKNKAFYGCSGLSGIEFPESLVTIGEFAFYGCAGISTVYITKNVQGVYRAAFGNCKNLESISVAEDNYVYDSRKNCNGVIRTDESVLVVGCEKTVIPEGVESIGNSAFRDCTQLNEITLPDSLISIWDDAFYGCSNLKEIELPKGLKSIQNRSFAHCDSLTDFFIPENVNYIYHSPFEGCKNLKTIRVAEDNTTYDSRNNCNAIIETETDTLIAGWHTTVVSTDVKKIGDYAFYDCDNLKSIDLPKGLTSIGNWAFAYCKGLKSVDLPEGLTSVGDYAFHDCSGLESICFPDSLIELSKCNILSVCSSNVIVYATKDSYGWNWAVENGFITKEPSLVESTASPEVTISPKPSTLPTTTVSPMDTIKPTATVLPTDTIPPMPTISPMNTIPPIPTSTVTVSNDLPESSDTPQGTNGKRIQEIIASSMVKKYGCKPFALKVSSTGDGKLTFKSKNKRVATITQKGIVKIKSYGKAKIVISATETQQYQKARKEIFLTVVPKSVSIKKLTSPAKKEIFCKWVKSSTVTGYEIYLSFQKDFSKNTMAKKYKWKKTQVRIGNIPSGKKIYIKIRTYKKKGKERCYSKWSSTRRVIVK